MRNYIFITLVFTLFSFVAYGQKDCNPCDDTKVKVLSIPNANPDNGGYFINTYIQNDTTFFEHTHTTSTGIIETYTTFFTAPSGCNYYGSIDTLQFGDTTLYLIQKLNEFGSVCDVDTICTQKICLPVVANFDAACVEVLDSVDVMFLQNDIAISGEVDNSSFTITNQTGGGTYTVLSDGVIRYFPDGTDKFVYDTFTYTVNSIPECKEVEGTAIIKIVPPPIYECVSITGLDADGNVLIQGSGAVEDVGLWEKSIQYSYDGGTWINPSSYQGGQLWIPVNPNDDPAILPFDVTIESGAYVRECLRAIGTPFEYCDTKRVPSPLVSFDGGNVIFSNADEQNECFVSESYEIEIKAFNAGWSLQESWTSFSYDPAIEAPDLSNLPATLAAIFTQGSDNFTLAYDGTQTTYEHIEIDLRIVHDYNCEDCPTALEFSTTDLTNYVISTSILCIECEAITSILDGSTISISNPSDISLTPASMGDILYTIYDENGVQVVTFGNGSLYDVNAGHYPMNSGTSYPLQGGSYYAVVTTPSCEIVCDYFDIVDTDICTDAAQINYNGLTSGSGFTYNLDINPSMAEIEYSFVTQTIPDQFIVSYEGSQIFDSGQVSTGSTPLTGTIPFSFNNDDFVTVTVVPDPSQPPLTVTIYSLSVGCCLGADLCVLPYRDAFVQRAVTDDCGVSITVRSAYMGNLNFVNFQPTYYLPSLSPESCIINNEQATSQFGFNYGCTGSNPTLHNSCFDNALPSSSIAINNGTNITVTFADNANYNQAKDYVQFLVSLLSNSNTISMGLFSNFDVNCGDDGTLQNDVSIPINTSMFQFIDGTRTIVINDNFESPTGLDCCRDKSLSELPPLSNWIEVWDNIGRTGRVRTFEYVTSTAGFSINGNFACRTIQSGIINSSCQNSNPLQDYTIRLDINNPSKWQLLRGDCNGVVISDGQTLPFGANAGGVYIENSDGFIVQEIDYTITTFDLSYYSGAQNETFADGEALRQRLETLTGQSWEYIPHYDVFVRTTGTGTLQKHNSNMKHLIIGLLSLFCVSLSAQVTVTHQRPFPSEINVIDNDFDTVFVTNPVTIVNLADAWQDSVIVSNLDEIEFTDLDDTDNDVTIVESVICADGGQAVAVSRYSSIGAYFSTEYRKFDGTIFTPVNFDCEDLTSTFVNEVCYFDSDGDLVQGTQRIDIVGTSVTVSLQDVSGATVTGTITPCVVDSEQCTYDGDPAKIFYNEAGGFYVRTDAAPTNIFVGDVSLLGSCASSGGVVNSSKKAEGRVVQNGNANNSNNVSFPYLFESTVIPTGSGNDGRRYEVRFNTPLPIGTDYTPSVTAISNEPTGDEPKALIVKGSINENGFDVITILDDNGANEDTQVFLSFTYEVNLK